MRVNDDDSSVIKYADDTVVMGLIKDQNEDKYFDTIQYVHEYCKDSHLELNVSKTKEMVIDFRRNPSEKRKVIIDGTEVSTCSEYDYLGCTLQDDLKWKRTQRNK